MKFSKKAGRLFFLAVLSALILGMTAHAGQRTEISLYVPEEEEPTSVPETEPETEPETDQEPETETKPSGSGSDSGNPGGGSGSENGSGSRSGTGGSVFTGDLMNAAVPAAAAVCAGGVILVLMSEKARKKHDS